MHEIAMGNWKIPTIVENNRLIIFLSKDLSAIFIISKEKNKNWELIRRLMIKNSLFEEEKRKKLFDLRGIYIHLKIMLVELDTAIKHE